MRLFDAAGKDFVVANRIFITGDTHGASEIGRLNKTFSVGRELDKDDYLVVCGDFGLVWADRSKYSYWLRWLDKKPFTTLFVDGNHENFDMLEAMDVERRLDYRRWFFGHYHEDRAIDDRQTAIFEDVIEIVPDDAGDRLRYIYHA